MSRKIDIRDAATVCRFVFVFGVICGAGVAEILRAVLT